MSWQTRWGNRSGAAGVSVSAAPFQLRLPSGKIVNGSKREIIKLAKENGVDRIIDRRTQESIVVGT